MKIALWESIGPDLVSNNIQRLLAGDRGGDWPNHKNLFGRTPLAKLGDKISSLLNDVAHLQNVFKQWLISSRVLDMRPKDRDVRASHASLCCVLEQETFILA